MKKVYIFIAPHFEETEAIGTIDVLRRAGIDVESVSISNEKVVESSHGVKIITDKTFNECDFNQGNMIILPGGMPGTRNLQNDKNLEALIAKYNKEGKYLAAICAAPLVYGQMDLLNGKEAVCYPGFEDELKGAVIKKDAVAVSSNFITSRGAGTVFDFALKLVEILKSKDEAEKVKNSIIYKQ
ncbi:MAG: DJ-1/PfpI family protein [Bacteroidales bacterium]|nr:DJ-1/PfpI family protein [Bacteroidales bacterium]